MTETHSPSRKIQQLGQSVLHKGQIDRQDIIWLLQLNPKDLIDLFYWAHQIRKTFLGDHISLCGIASIQTGSCSEDCRFCAQSAHYQTHITPQKMTTPELAIAAKAASENHAQHFGLVSSGRTCRPEKFTDLPEMIQTVKNTGLNCCASLGCLDDNTASQLRQLGLTRYHHNLETSRNFFPNVVTTHAYEDRLETIRAAKKAGMEVCSGTIFGLGESIEDRADLAMTLRELNVDSVPLNFLNPIPGTPFQDNAILTPFQALQIVASFRFALPDKTIRVAAGRNTVLRDLQSWIFLAGASGMMIGHYLTTAGRNTADDLQMLQDLGVTTQNRSPTEESL